MMNSVRFPMVIAFPVAAYATPLQPIRFGYWGTDQHVEDAMAIIQREGGQCEWINPQDDVEYRFVLSANGFEIQEFTGYTWIRIGDVDKTRLKPKLRDPESARLQVVRPTNLKRIVAILYDFLRAHGKEGPKPSSD